MKSEALEKFNSDIMRKEIQIELNEVGELFPTAALFSIFNKIERLNNLSSFGDFALNITIPISITMKFKPNAAVLQHLFPWILRLDYEYLEK